MLHLYRFSATHTESRFGTNTTKPPSTESYKCFYRFFGRVFAFFGGFCFVIWGPIEYALDNLMEFVLLPILKINNAQSSIKHKTSQVCDKGSLCIPKNMCLYAHYNALAHTQFFVVAFIVDGCCCFWDIFFVILYSLYLGLFIHFLFLPPLVISHTPHTNTHISTTGCVLQLQFEIAALDLAIGHWYEKMDSAL